MLSVLLLVTAFIVYGSLYPWQFHSPVLPLNPLWVLLRSWDFTVNRYLLKDTVVNVLLYFPFGATAYLWLDRKPLLWKLTLPVAVALLLSASMEMLQLYDAARVCSMLDVITNVAGAGIGVAVASRFRPGIQLRPRSVPALFLLGCWFGALLFPFLPDLSSHHLLEKLSAFTTPHASLPVVISTLILWLCTLRIAEVPWQRSTAPLILFVLPVRLFVSGLTCSWNDLFPAVLALALWSVWPAKSFGRDAALGLLACAGILLTGLAPFHFSSNAQAFSWIPFRALFSTNWESGVAIFFRKNFIYASAIWLFYEAGLSLLQAGLAIAALLGGLEAVQLWLPNHVSESTDPLQAIILAWLIEKFSFRNASAAKDVC